MDPLSNHMLIKQEAPYSDAYPLVKNEFQMPPPPPRPELSEAQINQLIGLKNAGQLNLEQIKLLDLQIERHEYYKHNPVLPGLMPPPMAPPVPQPHGGMPHSHGAFDGDTPMDH